MSVPNLLLAGTALLVCAAAAAIWHYTCPCGRRPLIRSALSSLAAAAVFLVGLTAVVWDTSGADAAKELLSAIGTGANIAGFGMVLVVAAAAARAYVRGTPGPDDRVLRRDLVMTAVTAPLCATALAGQAVFRALFLS